MLEVRRKEWLDAPEPDILWCNNCMLESTPGKYAILCDSVSGKPPYIWCCRYQVHMRMSDAATSQAWKGRLHTVSPSEHSLEGFLFTAIQQAELYEKTSMACLLTNQCFQPAYRAVCTSKQKVLASFCMQSFQRRLGAQAIGVCKKDMWSGTLVHFFSKDSWCSFLSVLRTPSVSRLTEDSTLFRCKCSNIHYQYDKSTDSPCSWELMTT